MKIVYVVVPTVGRGSITPRTSDTQHQRRYTMARSQWVVVAVAEGGVTVYGPVNSKKEGEDWAYAHLRGWDYGRSHGQTGGYFLVVPLYTAV
jgi:hypothetical protein